MHRPPSPKIDSLSTLIDRDSDDAVYARLVPLAYAESQAEQDTFFATVWPGLVLRAAKAGAWRSLGLIVALPRSPSLPLPPQTLSMLLRHAPPAVGILRPSDHVLDTFTRNAQDLSAHDWLLWWQGPNWSEGFRSIEGAAWFKATSARWAQTTEHYPALIEALLRKQAYNCQRPQDATRIASVLTQIMQAAPHHANELAEAWMHQVQGHPGRDKYLCVWRTLTQDIGLPVPSSFWASCVENHRQRLSYLPEDNHSMEGWMQLILDFHHHEPRHPPPGFQWDENTARTWGAKMHAWKSEYQPMFSAPLLRRALFNLEAALGSWGCLTPATLAAFDNGFNTPAQDLLAISNAYPEQYRKREEVRLRVCTDSPHGPAPPRVRL